MSQNNTITDKNQGEIVPAHVGDVGLPYAPYDFRAKRWRNAAIARAADTAGYRERGDKYAACGSALGFGINETGRHLTAANFCRQRLCPICTSRLAKRNAQQLAKVLTEARRQHPGMRYLFLTLAPRSVHSDQLKLAVSDMLAGWTRLLKQIAIKRAVLGSMRAVEVTRNRETCGYHPHIHAIIAVPAEYFEASAGLYIRQPELVKAWRRALRVDYDPTAHISALYDKRDTERRRKPGEVDTTAAVYEASKYSVKDADIIDSALTTEEQAEVWQTLLVSLHKRRLAAFGGVLREVAKTLKADELEAADIIGADEGTDADADRIAYAYWERWAWSMGAGDYICTDSEPYADIVSGIGTDKGVPVC